MNATSATNDHPRGHGPDRLAAAVAWFTLAHAAVATVMTLCQLLRWLP